MQNLEIFNLATCTTPYQAANKYYVDLLFNYGTPTPLPLPELTFTLIGTTPTMILGNIIGNFDLYINGNSSGSPMASFSVIKNDQTVIASITRHNSMCGISLKERLYITWNPGQGIFCHKDSTNYDGNYTLQYREL